MSLYFNDSLFIANHYSRNTNKKQSSDLICSKYVEIVEFDQIIKFGVKGTENTRIYSCNNKFGWEIPKTPARFVCRWCVEPQWEEKRQCKEENQKHGLI